MIKRLITTFCIGILEIFTFSHWFSCWRFSDEFYFTSHVMSNDLLMITNGEQGVPIVLVRLFFNKVFFTPWGLSQTLLQYWDIRFLGTFVSIVGAIGVYLGVWYFISRHKKNIYVWALFILSILFPLVEMFFTPNLPFVQRITPMFFLYVIWSLFGVWQFLKAKHETLRYCVIICLLLVSILFILLLPHSLFEFCLKA